MLRSDLLCFGSTKKRPNHCIIYSIKTYNFFQIIKCTSSIHYLLNMKKLFFLLLTVIIYTTEAQTLVVLGTLQDGGSPHMGCVKSCCATERPNDYVVSLGVIDESKHLLFDASPDIVYQTNYLNSISPAKDLEIFLTHAHMGHYSGLIHLGRESANSKKKYLFMQCLEWLSFYEIMDRGVS